MFRLLLKPSSLRLTLTSLGFVFMLTPLSGCELARNQITYDRSADIERQDYRHALAPRPVPEDEGAAIPELQDYVAMPTELQETMPLVSISVNQTVALRDILFELADQAEIDLELDPKIRGSVIFTARERPFDEVIDRICEMSGLRYNFEDGLLRVELDRPYSKSYKVGYLDMTRTWSSSISTTAQLASGGEGGGGGGGSSASVASEASSSFWTDLENNLKSILASGDNVVSLSTSSDPMATPRVPVQAVPPSIPTEGVVNGTEIEGDDGIAPPASPEELAVAQQEIISNEPPVLEVQVPSGSSEEVAANAASSFSINKNTGLVSIYTTEKQHRNIGKYLNRLEKIATSQVLIEAKILEVSLTDEYASGINWNYFDAGAGDAPNRFNVLGKASTVVGFNLPEFTTPAPASSVFTATLNGLGINAAIDAMARFGTVRALASPRVTVLNNQAAVLQVVENTVYFDVEVSTDTADGVTTTTIEGEKAQIPEGVVINVLPSLNLESEEVSLALRPSITKIIDFVEDPIAALNYAIAGIPAADRVPNLIPETAIQEIDSMVNMKSGQVLVMGGLMQDTNNVVEEGVPILGDLPFIGNAFKNHKDVVKKTELVIFIKATIIPGSNTHDTDKDLYKKFGMDRRPFRM